MEILIRSEIEADKEDIEQVTIAAFAEKSYSDQTEHLVINALRKAGVLTLSLVAEVDGKILGHVGFSSVSINGKDLDWYGIGPVSVAPEFQKQGVGSKLIKEGMKQIREVGAKGCVLLGNPNYYQRFGFKHYPHLVYKEAPAPEYFMAYPFYEEVPNGQVEFHSAFYVSS